MKPAFLLQPIMGLLVAVMGSGHASAAITALHSPAELASGSTLTFNGYPNYTFVNTLFQTAGLTFTRDDGDPIYLLDWTSLGRETTSLDGVLATVRNVVVDPNWSTHLNVISARPLSALGAYFGNDQGDADFSRIRLSIYTAAGELLGSVEVAANGNTHVDQFVGVYSDIPFSQIRFENLDASGVPSRSYSVVIDDLVFALPDTDGDGIPDNRDDCPNTVRGAVVDHHGCSIKQLVPCTGPPSGGEWKNHGEYVLAVARTAKAFLGPSLITRQQASDLIAAAARSDCGKKPKITRPPPRPSERHFKPKGQGTGGGQTVTQTFTTNPRPIRSEPVVIKRTQ